MAYVFLDPADYIVGKPISFEEYAQLVENANQAYGAGTNHGEVFAAQSGASAIGLSVSGSSPGPYTLTVPSGVTLMRARGAGSGGGGPSMGGGAGGNGVYQDWVTISVSPGEILTITVGIGGNGGAAVGGPPGNNGSNGTASTITGSVSGSLFTADYGRGGVYSGAAGANGTRSGSRGSTAVPIMPASGVYMSGGPATNSVFVAGNPGNHGFIELAW
jgi:hypothetical protein